MISIKTKRGFSTMCGARKGEKRVLRLLFRCFLSLLSTSFFFFPFFIVKKKKRASIFLFKQKAASRPWARSSPRPPWPPRGPSLQTPA